MRRIAHPLAVVVVLPLLVLTGQALAPAGATAAPAPPTTRPAPPATRPGDRFAGQLESCRAEHKVPALGAALFEDGRVAILAVAGTTAVDGRDRVAPDDAWHLGSDTKAMTATLAARLVEQGKIRWDTTLAEGLPELADAMHDVHKAVTLRQLLGHRAGIIGHEANQYAMPILWQIQNEPGDRPMRARRVEAARRILQAPPAGAPGKEFRYSNYGYVVACAMLERAGDAAYEELMRREVFGPLGMTSAGFGPPPRISGHVKRGQAWAPLNRDNPAVSAAAGAVHVNLADWAKFAAAHLGRVEGYLKPETIAFLHEPVPGEGGPAYALGWGVGRTPDGGPLLSHAGSNTMWFAVIQLDPARKRAYLAACNAWDEPAVNAAVALLHEHDD